MVRGTDQLLIRHLLWRMRHVHADSEITAPAQSQQRGRVRRTFAETETRCRRLASGLRRLGIGEGDRVAVLGWNTPDHLEVMLAVPAMGASLLSLNLRTLSRTDAGLTRVRALFLDTALVDDPRHAEGAQTLAGSAVARGIPVIMLGDDTPDSRLARYEELVDTDSGVDEPDWSVFSELTCAFELHTGGTTGAPKRYEVSHRAVVLHALSQLGVDAAGLRRSDRVLPLAPFFHVNGWGYPFVALLAGAGLVLAGRDLSPARIAHILSEERVTVAAAVPTVWHDVCVAVAGGGVPRPANLRRIVTGGNALTSGLRSEVEEQLRCEVASAWGMTETLACSTYETDDPAEAAGRPVPLLELRVPPGSDPGLGDGTGELQVSGPFVVGEVDSDGWLATGDVASWSSSGRLVIRDRLKDLIKSGGEWIPSVELEQILARHAGVHDVAVVAQADPRWGERPLAFVVANDDVTVDALRAHVLDCAPRWWLPDDFKFVAALPRTSMGKTDKGALRDAASAGAPGGGGAV